MWELSIGAYVYPRSRARDPLETFRIIPQLVGVSL